MVQTEMREIVDSTPWRNLYKDFFEKQRRKKF
jgi:hypothetical protein